MPFTVRSDIPLGRRAAAFQVEHGADVNIYEGHVPDELPGEGVDGVAFQVRGSRMLLKIPNGLRYLIEEGERIVYARCGRHSDREVLLFLLGSAWAALCYQRGMVPLHASAILKNGAVHAFTGPSGAGKSTLAAALSARERPFFTDDLLLLDPLRMEPEPLCFAVQNELKLWSDAISMTHSQRGDPVRDDPGFGKFYSTPNQRSGAASGILCTLFVLDGAVTSGGPTLARLDGAEALLQVAGSVYRPAFAAALLGRRRLYQTVAEVARRVQVMRFRRSLDPSAFNVGADFMDCWIEENG